MSIVTEILTNEQIHDLWGAGFTVLPRLVDPFELPQHLIPRGMVYQWNETPDQPGWRPVPYQRHDGYFGPAGMAGDIELSGLHLCEQAAAKREEAIEKARAKAHSAAMDWRDKTAADGFSGHVRTARQTIVGDLEDDEIVKVGEQATPYLTTTKTIETTTQVPMDMLPHMTAVFNERDRLSADVVLPDRTLKPGPIADRFYAAVDADKGAPWWPTLYAILLPIAVENVRNSLKSQESSDE